MFKRIIVCTIFVSLVVTENIKRNYNDYKVMRMTPESVAQNVALHKMQYSSDDGYSFWSSPNGINDTVDLMVAPEKFLDFKEFMRMTGIPYSTFIDNVQRLVDDEMASVSNRSARAPAGFSWNKYHSLEEIYNWLELLSYLYPDYVEVIVGGQTYEGRLIKGVKVSFQSGNPGVFLEGNIHAREWISSATVTYILNELLTSRDPKVRKLAENYDWYIFPVVNPDGFVYSHTHDRLWRKTTKPYAFGCLGSDPNRNFGYEWNQGGSSNWPCAEIYAGTHPFCEIETYTFSNYITSIAHKLSAYISFHSYSQVLLIPYGHTKKHLDNYDQLYQIGKKTLAALAKRYGTEYTLGCVSELMYIATGSSIDWVKGNFGIPLTFVYELRDNGKYGFLLPAKQIIPTGKETLDSLIAMFAEARAQGIAVRADNDT